MSWKDAAACKGKDTALFFPASKEEASAGGYRAARAVCASCVVRAECLEAAMEEEAGMHGWRCGLRGGKSPTERDRYARQVRFCPCCGTRFAPSTKERYCSDACRRAVHAEAQAAYRARAA